MAALMTSVLDNTTKVAQYIVTCRNMGIEILPPGINEGEGTFTAASDSSIRYGLSAIKSLGRPVIEAIVEERANGGRFKDIKDFISRLSGKEVNKRTVESFIKSGAFDSFGLTRKQMMLVYGDIMDKVSSERKTEISGQMSLFDMFAPDEKPDEITIPDVGEYTKSELLAMEKEVLGIYASGHPLDEYEGLLNKNITCTTADFIPDDETGMPKVNDDERVIVGGMIAECSVKNTRQGQNMAFLKLEDRVGTVEVIVFPKVYRDNRKYIEADDKVFVKGHVKVDEETGGKVICDSIIPFSQIPKECWIKFPDKESYLAKEQELYDIINASDGNDRVIVYLEKEKAVKKMPLSMTINADPAMIGRLMELSGEKNVKVVEKSIEK